jgi:PPM family protein phosphatase
MNQLAPIRAAMQTDRGRVRDHNEDFIARQEPTTPAEEDAFGWIYIVADGVGGADAGEIASKYASQQTLSHYLADEEETNLGQRLIESMQSANSDLRKLVAQSDASKRMATTMVAAIVTDGHAYIANVGDSRGYHWRNNALHQVTKDQSLVAKLLEEGAITEEEAAHHPHRNIILYSIGSEKTPQIDLYELGLAHGDKIFLCSDGLTRHVSDEEICSELENIDIDKSAERLIELANERGGQDNISVAIINYGATGSESASTSQESTMRVAMAPEENSDNLAPLNHAFLLPYTALLAVVEAVLIVLVWALLRV